MQTSTYVLPIPSSVAELTTHYIILLLDCNAAGYFFEASSVLIVDKKNKHERKYLATFFLLIRSRGKGSQSEIRSRNDEG